MAEYIEREAHCKKCIHYDICDSYSGLDVVTFFPHNEDCEYFKPTADVVEVRHGRWHIMPEDPYDESECPTEEGWYRIITTDGEEMTDYYFNKPTVSGRGVVYWKNCKKGIRAWAKMDGKGEGE